MPKSGADQIRDGLAHRYSCIPTTMMKRQRSAAHSPRRQFSMHSPSLSTSAGLAALSLCSISCALLSLSIFSTSCVDAFSVPPSLTFRANPHKGIRGGSFTNTDAASGSALQLYPPGYRPYEAPHKRISPYDPSKYVPTSASASVSASAAASDDLDDNESSASGKGDNSQILSLTRKDKRQVYLPEHLQQPAQRSAILAATSSSKPSWRLRMAQNMIDKRQRRRLRLRSFIQRCTRVAGLSLALWQMAVTTGTSMDESPGHAQSRSPVARQDSTGSMNSMTSQGDSTSTGQTAMAFKSRSHNIVVTSRGGGRRGKSVAPPPSAGERIRSKIASQSKSMAKGGVDRTVDFYRSADPNKKAAVGIIGAVAVGVGIGVEVAGRNDKEEDDGEVLSNNDKLRKEIMDEIDWYNERYGTKQNDSSADDTTGLEMASGLDTLSVSPTPSPEPPSTSGGIRKPDPQAQVKAILDNAKETERRARQARREGPGSIAPPPTAASGGVDYSQVKGLSTKEGDGKSRAQLLIETTARMEQRAEAQRLEMTRQRDFAEEQEARRVQESLKNRIDNFIAVTEAEEKNQGFGNRPGDRGRALKQEVSRLNGELDQTRNKVAVLEAELEEKKKIEALLRQEIDRLRRSG